MKFAAQLLVASAAVIAGILYPLGSHAVVNIVFTMFWIVGLTNAFNLLDNMDGLSGGVAIIALLTIALLMRGDAMIVQLALIMIGALLGFIVFNASPARIFMGDTGSLAIGFLLACMSILCAQRISSTPSVLVVPVLIVFLPIFDTLLVSFTRKRGGRAISAGARDHSSHRLVLLGMTERQAVFTLYAVSAISGVTAYLWKIMLPNRGHGILVCFVLTATSFWIYLAQMELPADWLSQPSGQDKEFSIGIEKKKIEDRAVGSAGPHGFPHFSSHDLAQPNLNTPPPSDVEGEVHQSKHRERKY
jgi:UDP-GlcNAc:undecaprenyl-phosphate GlcNAc-1-phosphate transferase